MLYDCRTVADRDRGIAAAVEAAKSGELVVLPTDTVYGVGADAFTPHAVSALHSARGMDRRVAPPVLVGSRHTLDGLVYSLPKAARELADAFWPGALTIMVEHSASLQWDLGETGGVVGIRMPLHPVALEVLREEARDELEYSVRIYLEAGAAADQAPSTVVDVTGDVPLVRRAGAIPFEKLRDVVPDIVTADG
jgi:L-threonylcarbamoyladenylate synthase